MSERLAEVRSQLGGARLIVVTKYADEAQVEALLALGVRDFGENRAKQLGGAPNPMARSELAFHRTHPARDIRHLARAATSAHAFDRPEVAERWVEYGPPIHLQVNLAEEAQKAGIPEQGLHEATDRLRSHGVKLHGLSLMPPRVEESEASRPWDATPARARRCDGVVRLLDGHQPGLASGAGGRLDLRAYRAMVARGPHRLTRIVRRSPSFKR